MCKNKQVGYCLTPTANERMISFSYDACPYQVEKKKTGIVPRKRCHV